MELELKHIYRHTNPLEGETMSGTTIAHIIKDVAHIAAGGYDRTIDGEPAIYAQWVLHDWYLTEYCPKRFSDPHMQWVIREYFFKIADQIVVEIEKWKKVIEQFEE